MGSQPSKSEPLNFVIVTHKEEAQELLNAAEEIDLYREECYLNKTNSKARISQGYRANSMTYRELKMFELVIDNAKPLLPRRLKEDLREVRLIQLMPSADGGMPHTRPGGIICYPDLSRFFNASTLVHELWHVHQRMYEAEWDRIFDGMGWKVWTDDYLPASLEDHRRFNPDTIRAPVYVYNDTWVPVPMFKDISKPDLTQVEIWFYNIKSKYHHKSVPDALLTDFPYLPPSAYEHPREIAAYMLSEPEKYKDSPGFARLLHLIGGIAILP